MMANNREMTEEEFVAEFRQQRIAARQQREETEEAFTELSLEEDAPSDVPTDDREGTYTPPPQITLPGTGEIISLLKVPRFHRSSQLNAQIRKDWIKVIERHRDSFDAVLYRATEADPIEGETGKNFTELNNHNKKLTYQEPELVKVLDTPNMDAEHFTAMDQGDGHDTLDGGILMLRAAADYIPHGSVFSFYEETGPDQQRLVSWYVLEIYIYGSQSAGYLYVCVPAMGVLQTNSGEVMN